MARKRLFASNAVARVDLRRAADAALASPALSVHDKTMTPPSGDKGDYYSIGPYWWPNQAKADGLPYVREDGRSNPQRDGDAFDSRRLSLFTDHVELLALASYYLADPRYARGAATLLRVWLIDPKTRMNPNLHFGQAVPGFASGRAEELIDLPRMGSVIDAIGLIEPGGALDAADLAGLRAWFGRFTDWMTDSAIGRDERGRHKNHALFYDYMLAHFALFASKEDLARDVARDFPRRLARQIDERGALPGEIARTRSWHYSVFALTAAVRMAGVAECVGHDLWSSGSGDARGVRRGLDFLLPYRMGEKTWLYPEQRTESGPPAGGDGAELFEVAAWGSGSAASARAAGDAAALPLWLARYPDTYAAAPKP